MRGKFLLGRAGPHSQHVLSLGEVALHERPDGSPRTVVGDGVTPVSSLPTLNQLDVYERVRRLEDEVQGLRNGAPSSCETVQSGCALLRDHFAAAALTGLLAGPAAGPPQTFDDFASEAYRLADAMLRERSRAGQKIAQCDSFCSVCRDNTNHDAAPAARAETSVKEPMAHATGEPGGEPEGKIGTGKQPAPPCVETDGFSSSSSGGQINRSAERESPRRECGESWLRDVARPDTKGKVAGGPEHHISDRPQPVRDDVSDRSKPISDERLTALEELSALDQELEGKHGLQGNPMIKARRNNESAGAGITDAGPRLRQMNDVLEENERLRGQLAWTERERDSLRVAIHNLRDYVAELNAELYAKSDENRVLFNTKRDATPPPQATPPQGSVQGEGRFRVSQNANEPVAWYVSCNGWKYVSLLREAAESAGGSHVVPLYRHPQPTLTDEEREAVRVARDAYADDDGNAECEEIAAVLTSVLERLGGGR